MAAACGMAPTVGMLRASSFHHSVTGKDSGQCWASSAANKASLRLGLGRTHVCEVVGLRMWNPCRGTVTPGSLAAISTFAGRKGRSAMGYFLVGPCPGVTLRRVSLLKSFTDVYQCPLPWGEYYFL